jgi:hypothetical protein
MSDTDREGVEFAGDSDLPARQGVSARPETPINSQNAVP